ncbi:uncharacterized protein C4orf54 homolog [Dunckerocampus dactyliophorus]|uniref:uncharacterized protein C4orf54 homolog n=1 Tax=Dunckerocampus dactyliophorus TaxID=161453 RepID=UPI0024074CC7|nr:uncharacterized protein C4orf54 homolog [Dunckerocampus dactyliophorus]
MEAAEETLTYRDGPRPHRTLLPGDKLIKGDTGGHIETKSESNYVDLDMRPDGNKTVKVTFTGEGSQLSVKSDGSRQGERKPALEERPTGNSLDMAGGVADPTQAEEQDSGDRVQSECSEGDDLQYTDMYLNSRTESDDGTSVALSDHSGTDTLKDESHYITTHEIQLTELDHDVDYDLGRGASWDFEDDNLVYSFVDYASFESNKTRTGTLILEGKLGVSTEQDDSDLCDSDKCASSDESLCKNHMIGDAALGKIHLSIKTSREEPVGVVDEGAKRFSFVRTGPLGDNRAKYFIPAPGRQHLATKLRRKDINEYSSGASSSISELDDADKEVRNLTARSFRSLACPYFDTINLSTSSESSMSEYGLNKWSAYVDWNYGRIPRGAERSVIAHKTSSATLEMNQTAESKTAKAARAHQRLSVGKKAELKDQQGVTLNVQCNVEATAAGTRRPKSTRNRSSEAHGAVLARSGCEMQYHTDSTGNTHKRAIFASSLLKNVISKKMQFEQERKMERGEISDTYPALVSPCFLEGGKDRSAARGFQRQNSESGSGFTNSGDDLPLEGGSRPASCEPTEEQKSTKVVEDSCERPKVVLSHSQSSAFNSWKDEGAAKEDSDRSNMLTKLLFVPSWQRFSKNKEAVNSDVSQTMLKTGNMESESDKGAKTPEIKICLRSVKENKGGSLNIASLLTPKINSNTVNTFRAAGDAKYHILSASDKIPNFTVRDIRHTKCKFQTPIYRVRDVRKLVKSSYHFVSLDNSDGKGGTAEAADKLEDTTKKEPVKQVSPSPIVIKCHSVKTNVKSQKDDDVPSKAPPVAAKQSNADQSEAEKLLKQRQEKFAGEAAEWRVEARVPKQAALEKLKAAVKTMEQLYVFDRNEWKRKAEPPQPITDSHVLSLIASEEQGAEEEETAAEPQEENSTNVVHVPCVDEPQQRKTFSNKSVLHLGKSNKVSISSALASPMKSCKAPLSVKIEPRKQGQVEQRKLQMSPTNPSVTPSDSENYLTIPGLGYTSDIKVANREAACTEVKPNMCQQADMKRVLMAEYPASSVYHQPAGAPQTQQVLCFSPPITTLSPPPSTAEAGLQTQRKMLLDPTTGHYYLVDTPIQAPTKRLFDPETGQYVDVPHSPVAPIAPVTPVPLSLPPLALSRGAYAPTYMIYPGFIPSPTLLPQSPSHSEQSEKALKNTKIAKQEVKESPYYSATAEAPPTPSTGGAASTDRKPIISITTQQGPRIIAPPSFDGTTMSFVVEHR